MNTMKTTINPINDHVFLRRAKAEEKIGSIFVPQSAAKKPTEATVLFVGPGKLHEGRRVEPSIKRGDRVLLGEWVGIELKVDDEEVLCVREDEILGVLG